MIRLSRRAAAVKPSATLATAAKARALKAKGVDVVLFGTGEPDFDTPDHIKIAAVKGLREGRTHYPPLSGIPELKGAIQDRLQADHDLSFGLSEILVTVGAKQALYDLCQAVLEEDDQAVIPGPYWVSYPDMVILAGAEPIHVPADPGDGFVPRAEDLEAAITSHTRLLFLNSPSNPSGAVYPREALEAIAEVVRRHPQVVVVSDDIYEKLIYDGAEFLNLLMVAPDLRDRIVLVNGVSKAYAMTGWRLGWAAGPPEVIAAMQRIQGQSTSGATAFAQMGAVAALTGDQGVVAAFLAEFDRRRRHMVSRLNDLEGVKCAMPGGAFYAFPDVRGVLARRLDGEVIGDTARLCELLLDEVAVAAVPGAPFGAEGFLRMSFATSMDEIDRGIDRLGEFVGRLE